MVKLRKSIVSRFPFCSIQFEVIRFYLTLTFPLQCCRSPPPPTAGNLDLAQVATSLLYRELARSLPLFLSLLPPFAPLANRMVRGPHLQARFSHW